MPSEVKQTTFFVSKATTDQTLYWLLIFTLKQKKKPKKTNTADEQSLTQRSS